MNKKKTTPAPVNEAEYGKILRQAISQIRIARLSMAKQVNASIQSIYWNLGKLLSEKQLAEGYGSGVVKQLSVDQKSEFPDMGLSPRNLWDMKRFYERYYQADVKLRQAVAVLPWGHNMLFLNKIQYSDSVRFHSNRAFAKSQHPLSNKNIFYINDWKS